MTGSLLRTVNSEIKYTYHYFNRVSLAWVRVFDMKEVL